MTDLVWTALALIAKGFKPPTLGEMRGGFLIADDKDRSAVELCLNDFDNTGLSVRGGLEAAVVGKTVEVEFCPKPGWASVSATMDAAGFVGTTCITTMQKRNEQLGPNLETISKPSSTNGLASDGALALNRKTGSRPPAVLLMPSMNWRPVQNAFCR